MPQSLEQFGQTVKAKYPQYANLSDTDVANKVLEKYPQYKSQVSVQPQATAPQPFQTGDIDPALQSQLQARGMMGKLNELQQTAGQADKSSFYAGGTDAIKPSEVARLGASYVNRGVEKFGKAMEYTGIPQAVGGAVSALGAPIGLTVGGIGKIAQNVIENKPTGEGVLESAAQVATQTGGFGYDIGKGAAATAPLGAAGRIPGAVMALGQGYEGARNVAESIKTGNVEQGFQGALDLAQGVVGLRGAAHSRGAIYNPEAVQAAKDVFRGAGEKVGTAVEGAKGKLSDAVYNNTVKTYREVLNQTQREIQGEAKWNKNTPKLLADNGIIPEAENGRLKNGEAIKQTREKMGEIGNRLSEALKSKPTSFDLNEAKAIAVDNVKKQKGVSALEQNKQVKAVESFFDAEIARNGSPIVDGSLANEIKQGAWNTTFDAGDKVGSNAIYQAGHVLKDLIESKYKDENIRAINRELGDWAAAKRFLEKSEGRRLRGSFFGNMGARIGGGALGTVVGGPLGGIIGQEVGNRLQKAIIDPQNRLAPRQKLLQSLKTEPRAIDVFKAKTTPYDIPEIVRLRQENASLPSTHLINTPERTQLRESVKAQILAKQPNVRQERVANIVIGPPAAGKSVVFAEPLAKKYGARIIDSDMAKELLPEFEGGKRAGAVHEESDMIATDIRNQSIKGGENIVLPLVGKDQAKILRLAERLKEEGYTVNLFLNELPAAKSAQRAVARFKSSGRFVDPAYVLEVGDKPTRTFNAIKNNPLFDYYEHRSNDVPMGKEPRLVSQSGLLQKATAKKGTPKTVRVWIKSRFSNDGAYADIPVIRKEENITLYQGGDGKNQQFWTPNKEYAAQFGKVKEKTGTFYRVDNGNRVTAVYVEAPE